MSSNGGSTPWFDYGEGKSREQESRDSAEMLGLVLLVGAVEIIVVALAVVYLIFG
jgi:hypothetical protein